MSSQDEALRRELEATVAAYRSSLGPRIAALEVLRAALAGGRTPAAEAARLRADLHRELHSIAGSGRTFGLAGVSEAARAAEVFVEHRCPAGSAPDAAAWEALKPLLQDLAAVSKAAAA
jgi:HPt (histidine-containing phosphotransfer) domain-containing protein